MVRLSLGSEVKQTSQEMAAEMFAFLLTLLHLPLARDAAQPDDAICTMKPTPKKGKRSLAIVGMDVQKNVASPEYAIACTLDSVISRFNIQGRQDDEDLGKEEANYALPPSPSTSSSSSSSTKSSPSFTHGQAWCISIHPDPSAAVFATSGLGGYIKVLSSNVDDFGKERMSIPSRGEFVTCAYSPDGRIVASGTSEGQISLVDAETGQLVQFWTGELAATAALPLVVFDKRLSAEIGSGTRCPLCLQGHIGNVRSLAFSPDSSLIITGGDDKQINVFDIRGVQTSKDTQQSSISSYNNNGNYSMRSRRGGGSGQQVANLQGHTGWVLGLSCRDDGRVFASSSSDGSVFLPLFLFVLQASPASATHARGATTNDPISSQTQPGQSSSGI